MSVTSKQPQIPQSRAVHRLWKVPSSSARWIWLLASAVLYAGLLVWYFYTLRTQAFPGPLNDPLRLFGIIAYVLVLVTASYTLRRRFMRDLPGKVQNWLWLHTWLGVITILIALLHDNYVRITHDFCTKMSCLTNTYWATSALYALIFLVVSGIVGRLLDSWQTRIIAREASSNGVGIASAVSARLRDLEYTIESYCAGKSDTFKQSCSVERAARGYIPHQPDELSSIEKSNWPYVQEMLKQYTYLSHSLRRLQLAQRIIHSWRTIHIILASLAMFIITYHSIMELLTNVWHILVLSN
jgi:hypothetical protein